MTTISNTKINGVTASYSAIDDSNNWISTGLTEKPFYSSNPVLRIGNITFNETELCKLKELLMERNPEIYL